MSQNGDYDLTRGSKRSASPRQGRRGCAGNCTNEGSESSDEERSKGCTDIVPLIVYVIFCILMSVIAIFAVCYGNPLRLINGMDSFGNICGVKNDDGNMTFTGLDMSSKPFVFFFDPSNLEDSTRICVEQCPDEEIRDLLGLKEFYQRTAVSLCQYDYDLGNLTTLTSTNPGPNGFVESLCPKLPYPGSIALMKRCIAKPDGLMSRFGVPYRVFGIGYLNGLNIFKQLLGNLAVTWSVVLGLTVVAFVIAFLLLCCVHFVTPVIAYIIFSAASIMSIAFTSFLWWTYADLKSMLDSSRQGEVLEEAKYNAGAFLAFSIFSTILAVALHLIIFYLRNRVEIVVQLFREASRALRAMPFLIIQPLITYIALTIFFLGWLLVMLCLATSDYETKRSVSFLGTDDTEGTLTWNETSDQTHPSEINGINATGNFTNRTVSSNDIIGVTFIEYSDGVWVKYMWWIYVIGLIWCSEFILACQQFIISSSIATWYFSRDRANLKCIVAQSARRLVKYHLGSVALGSFAITVLKVPRLILNFLQRILRKFGDRTCIKWLTKCCTFCLACFDNWLKYIHHNAYAVISIQCINFCPASRLAFSALVGNALQISVVNSTGDFVLFLAKCITAGMTGLIAIVAFRLDQSLYFFAIPVFLTVVFAYFVAHSVISIFEMAVDTLFLCFCEDHNMNYDTRNFYAPGSLLQYMTDDAPRVVALGRRFDEAGPIPIKLVLDESATPEERHPMNVIRA